MAPSAISPIMDTYTITDGPSLEALSDSIDAVNVLTPALIPTTKSKNHSQFRNYTKAKDSVRDFYHTQHTLQTVDFNLRARAAFKSTVRAEMSVWDAMEKLDTLLDESDPDTDLGQIQHLLQSAEAIRRDGKPRWMQLTGLIHDLGKLLTFFGASGQWEVVGDTFPIGCAFSPTIIYGPSSFSQNPDFADAVYSTEHGIYKEGCGMDNVMLSWGHDEYLYHVVKDQSTLPKEALAMIRYHSFYPWHRDGAYEWMMGKGDHEMREAVREFNPYDLYSKSDGVPKVEELKVCLLYSFAEFGLWCADAV